MLALPVLFLGNTNFVNPTDDTTPPPVGEPIIDFGDNHPAQPYDNFLNAAFQDITDWWADHIGVTDRSYMPWINRAAGH